MIIVRRKGEVVRLGLFLILFGLMAYFVMTRADSFRTSAAPGSSPEKPAASAPLPGASGIVNLGFDGPDARDFFADARLTRDQDRSLRKQELRATIDNPNVDAAVRKAMSEELQAVMKYASLETQAEALIRSRGVEDVLVTLTAHDAMVSVQGKDDRQLAVQLADAVAKLTGLKLSAVSVRFQQ